MKIEMRDMKTEMQDMRAEMQDMNRRLTGLELHIENFTDKKCPVDCRKLHRINKQTKSGNSGRR